VTSSWFFIRQLPITNSSQEPTLGSHYHRESIRKTTKMAWKKNGSEYQKNYNL